MARLAREHWYQPAWWPYQDSGMPFEHVYMPLFPVGRCFDGVGGLSERVRRRGDLALRSLFALHAPARETRGESAFDLSDRGSGVPCDLSVSPAFIDRHHSCESADVSGRSMVD